MGAVEARSAGRVGRSFFKQSGSAISHLRSLLGINEVNQFY